MNANDGNLEHLITPVCPGLSGFAICPKPLIPLEIKSERFFVQNFNEQT
jgi:hypothetical protein